MPEKTAPQWYLDLPKDIQPKATHNFNTSGLLAHKEYKYPSLKDALKCGFVWGKSVEGFEYWQSIFDRI